MKMEKECEKKGEGRSKKEKKLVKLDLIFDLTTTSCSRAPGVLHPLTTRIVVVVKTKFLYGGLREGRTWRTASLVISRHTSKSLRSHHSTHAHHMSVSANTLYFRDELFVRAVSSSQAQEHRVL